MLNRFRPNPAAAALVAGLAILSPHPLAAQAMVQPLGQTDADLLAAQMRQLASNPRDLSALIAAGDLSLRLGDLSGAAALYARADKIDSRDGRVKAGMGSVLVRSERPGEALRFYQQAERAGLAPAVFAADRGLAYDLIGQPARAQNDYRLALASNRADETVRRYALSLGISGQRDQALAALDPLVRRQDRAAWRARAFVLAMNGDTAGANKIATTMMPAQLAQGLSAFFARLPALGAVDRAFAVHFGEVYATPERIADARLIPPLPPLAGEAPLPTQVAARPPNRRTPTRSTVAPPPAAVASTPPATPAVVMAPARPVVQALPRQPAPEPAPRTAAPVAVAARPATADTTVRPPAKPPSPARTPPTQVAAAEVPPVESHASTRRADAVLARIVASLTIPASELGVTDPEPAAAPAEVPSAVAAAPASDEGKRVVAGASAKEARDTAVRRAVAARLTGDAAADDAPAIRAEAAPTLTPAQRRAAERKALAEKQAAAEKKALADKAAAEKKAARANPRRIWVQVASGANEGDLGRAWKAAQAKSPASLGKRSGYTTGFKATNRVLTGPFKTDAEARAFVNSLAREGVSSFAFTSDPGQQVERLGGK